MSAASSVCCGVGSREKIEESAETTADRWVPSLHTSHTIYGQCGRGEEVGGEEREKVTCRGWGYMEAGKEVGAGRGKGSRTGMVGRGI